jgi:hypothetical protein
MGGIGPVHLIFLLLVLVGAVVVIVLATRNKSKLGVNLNRVKCPRCGALLPVVRAPANAEQAMWGGWTCACGCEVDKWGRERK